MTHPGGALTRPAVPAAGEYRLDPDDCEITFRTHHLFGLATVTGTMRLKSGEIIVDRTASRSSVTATVCAATFHTGNDRRDRDVKSTKFLAVDQHPDLAFRAAHLQERDSHWTLSGELTVRDTTRPLTLLVEAIDAAAGRLRIRATTRIDRYDFGVTAMRGMASRFVDVDVTVAAIRHGRPSTS